MPTDAVAALQGVKDQVVEKHSGVADAENDGERGERRAYVQVMLLLDAALTAERAKVGHG